MAVAVLLTPLPNAEAAGRRPAFQMPFPCADRWQATTRAGHPAVDWNSATGAADAGSPVVAAAAGMAVARYRSDWGYFVDIRHGGGWVTRYAHLQRAGVVEGPVAQGERIGYVGSSGRSTSPHLHWEQIRDGVRLSTLYTDGAAIRADGRTYTSRNCRQRRIHTGDVDGDGIDDVVTRFVRADGSSVVRVVRGRRERAMAATVALRPSLAALPPTALLAVGDTNGDGRADLNTVSAGDGGIVVRTFSGTRKGTFTRPTLRLSARWGFHALKALRAADVNGDGIDDLLTRSVRADGSSVIRVIRGAGASKLRARIALTARAAALPPDAFLAVGDTTDDSRADLNAVRRYGRGVRVVTFAGRSDGTFAARRSRLATKRWPFARLKAVHAGDVDGDGDADLTVRFVRADGASVLRTIRGARVRALRASPAKVVRAGALPPRAMTALADTTGDGRADLNAAYRHSGVAIASFAGRSNATLGARVVRLQARWAFHRLC